jgi:hypothetical protein
MKTTVIKLIENGVEVIDKIPYDDLSALEKISRGLKNIGEGYANINASIDSFTGFCQSVSLWFQAFQGMLFHPFLTIKAFQPWFIGIASICLFLHLIGFKSDKWLKFFLILSFLTIFI